MSLRGKVNRFVGVNYIDDNQNMEIPPEFWLQRLFDYDTELVVFPSRYRPYAYVLARRQRVVIASENKMLSETITQPDTKLCLSRGLVPVTLIFRQGVTWSIDNIIADLQSRDIWANGGAKAAADSVDAADARVEKAKRAKVRDDMWMRSGTAWTSYKRRTGQRVSSPGMGSERHAPKAGSSGSIAGSGLVFTDAI